MVHGDDLDAEIIDGAVVIKLETRTTFYVAGVEMYQRTKWPYSNLLMYFSSFLSVPIETGQLCSRAIICAN